MGSLGVPGSASTPLGRRGQATSSIDPKLDLDLDISDLGFDQISSYKRGGSWGPKGPLGSPKGSLRPPPSSYKALSIQRGHFERLRNSCFLQLVSCKFSSSNMAFSIMGRVFTCFEPRFGHSVTFWANLNQSGPFLPILHHFELFRAILSLSKPGWDILSQSESD